MADIVILGAGLTGLSAAYHLEQKGFFDYVLFEKESLPGGLCRSVSQDGFTFDFTGHLLHINDPYFKSFIETIVGFDNLSAINRRSFVYSQDTYTRYPYQINLYGLPLDTIAQCLEGFIKRKSCKSKSPSFYQWVLHNFGEGLGNHFFFPYQEKIFSYDIKKLSATWMGRFIPSTSVKDMVRGALSDNTESAVGYNANFFYPKTGGINFWVTKLAQALKKPVITNHTVESISSKEKRVYFTNGTSEPFKYLITTLPLDTILRMITHAPERTFACVADKLICNSVVNFNVGINRPDLSDKHWIYYPERKYPFYRIGFPHNFSATSAPPGCSSLYGEFSYINKPQEYITQQLHSSLEHVYKLLSVEPQDIVTEKIITIKHAYVIYNAWRDNNVPALLKNLEDYDMYSIGRYGSWKYSSMQEALLDGKAIADKLIP